VSPAIDRMELARILARQVAGEAARGHNVSPAMRQFAEEQALKITEVIVATGVPYLLVDNDKAILCFTCGMLSHNPDDITQKYCGHCHKFHEDL